jgi:hypothetical protein
MLQHVRDGAGRLFERVGLLDDHPDLAGPAALRYVNAVLGILREGGFSIAQTHHALHILGSRLGFTQALFDDSDDLESEAATALVSALGASHPHVVEMALAVTHDGALGQCDDGCRFRVPVSFGNAVS